MNILLLEDDEILAESLIDLFEVEDFKITHVTDGNGVLDSTFENSFDLYLFDVNVPVLNGFELLKSLRESGDSTPCIFLTALSDVASLSLGFDVGADDYVKKPFDFDELVVRIKALIKKRYNSYKEKIRFENLSFDLLKDELYKDDEFIPLPPSELKLTKLFFKNIAKTLAKEYILDELSNISDGSLRVHINKLRKLELPIVTVKGVGYRFGSS